VRWLAGGDVEVVSSSWVGVVRFTDFDVMVEPKLVGGALRVLRMLDYGAGVDMLRHLPIDRPLPADGSNLFELICLLLARETEALLRDGLLRDYREIDDTLDVLRGRLRYREQYLCRFGQLDRLEVRFDEYDSDTVENQLVTAALLSARRRVRERDLKFTLTRFAAVLEQACAPKSFDADVYQRSIVYNRRNSRYRPAHELALLVLRGLAYEKLFDTSSGRVTAFLLNMNTIFERFITRLTQEALASTQLRVTAQQKLRAVIRNDSTNRSYATIAPDLVIEDTTSGRAVPIDVKYKTYDARKVSTSDIYQTFLYAYALGARGTERRAGILFPSTAHVGQRLSIQPVRGPTAARIVAMGIDVPIALDALGGPEQDAFLSSIRALLLEIWGEAAPVTGEPAIVGVGY